VIQKNNRLTKRSRFPRRHFHRILRIANQRITTDSALQPFVTDFFTRLPWRGHAKVFCHLMFGILALTINHLMRLVI
jgi:hypothetical protein